MKELIPAVMVFIVTGVALLIGSAIMDKTNNVSAEIAPDGTLTTAVYSDASDALTTFTSLLPILALALIGGLSLFYIMGFIGNRSG